MVGVEHETQKKAATEVSEDPKETALNLIDLALNDGTTEEERRSAAVKAVKFIDKHNLLAHPLDELFGSKNPTVRAVSTVVDKITDPDFIDSVKTITGQFTRRGSGGGRRRRSRRR